MPSDNDINISEKSGGLACSFVWKRGNTCLGIAVLDFESFQKTLLQNPQRHIFGKSGDLALENNVCQSQDRGALWDLESFWGKKLLEDPQRNISDKSGDFTCSGSGDIEVISANKRHGQSS